MVVREGHLEGVEGQVDVGAILVAARGHDTLHEAHGMVRHGPAVVAALPVAKGDLGDDLAAFFDRFEHRPDIEVEAERVLHADLDVVEIDEYGNLESFV